MITLENRFFPLRSAACFLIEGGIIFASVLASFTLLRVGGQGGEELLSFRDAIERGILVAFFCQSCMYFLDLYDLKHSHSVGELFFSIIFAVGFVCIGIGLVSLAVPDFAVGGSMYYLTILFLSIFLFLWRSAFDFYLSRLAPRQNIVIVGTGNIARRVAEEVRKRERLGFHFLGYIDTAGAASSPTPDGANLLGTCGEADQIFRRNNVKRVVVAINERRGEYPVPQLLALKTKGYKILEWPAFFEKLSGRILIDSLSPSFFIFSDGFQKSPVIRAIRRAISFSVAAVAILALSPVMLFVAALIRLDSPGLVFYRQERVGLNGKRILLIKFRSMIQHAERETGAQWAEENDPRITRVGRWIRKFRIDELPQMLNVLKGDLDLVGPRPERPVFVEQLEGTFPYYGLRHTIRPGVTGWAQVMLPYCGTIEESKEKLQYDLFYVKNMSLKLDLLVLFRTVKIILLGRGGR